MLFLNHDEQRAIDIFSQFISKFSRYNEVIVEKQRLEQDVNSLRHFMEEERKEMAELRRQQQVNTFSILS